MRIGLIAVIAMSFAAPARGDRVSALVLSNGSDGTALTAQWVVPSLINLLGHFDCEATAEPSAAYRGGEIEEYDVLFLLGLDPEIELPQELLADLRSTDRPVCWLGQGLDQVADGPFRDRYGFSVGPAEPAGGYPRVVYRGQALERPDAPLTPITIADEAACEVLATAEGGGLSLPYALRSGNLWYFADVPLMEVEVGGSYLALCGELHQVLGRAHRPRRTALLTIIDVTPETNAGSLRGIAGYLEAEKLPYAIAVAPATQDPERGTEVRLSSQRGLVGALRAAQRDGATIIARGFAHRPAEGGGGDSEFWDARRGRPPLGHSPSDTGRAIEAAMAELGRCGLYPIVWSTPGGRASSADYAEIGRHCSTVWERRLASALAPGPQVLPFLIGSDSYGQQVIPDNLSPLRRTGEVESILEQARSQSVLPDPWLTAGIAPDAPLESVKLLVAGLREMDYEFADLRRTANSMKARSLQIHSREAPAPIADLMPAGWDATILGPGRRDLERFERPDRDDRARAELRPGALLITYPRGDRPRVVFAVESRPEELSHRLVVAIAGAAIVFAVAACAAFIVIYLVHVLWQRRR